MCTRSFLTILVCYCLLACFGATAGCRALDQAAADLEQAGAAARDEARDPQSPLPGPARTAVELAGLALWAGSTLYQQMRGKKIRKQFDQEKFEHSCTHEEANTMTRMHEDATQTLQAIVQGVEASPEKAATAVKAAIAKQMKRAKIYDQANGLVDELKGPA